MRVASRDAKQVNLGFLEIGKYYENLEIRWRDFVNSGENFVNSGEKLHKNRYQSSLVLFDFAFLLYFGRNNLQNISLETGGKVNVDRGQSIQEWTK